MTAMQLAVFERNWLNSDDQFSIWANQKHPLLADDEHLSLRLLLVATLLGVGQQIVDVDAKIRSSLLAIKMGVVTEAR